MNEYIYKLGVSRDWQIQDVYGLDREMLDFIPQPVKAVIVLFPCTISKIRTDANDEKEPESVADDLFYTHQLSRNACGTGMFPFHTLYLQLNDLIFYTVALVHGILNNLKDIKLKDDSIIRNYYDKAKDLTPEERGKLLDSDKSFASCHEEFAQEGQTSAPNRNDAVFYHYVALTCASNGDLMELDGSKKKLVQHGKTNPKDFLYDAAEVCKKVH